MRRLARAYRSVELAVVATAALVCVTGTPGVGPWTRTTSAMWPVSQSPAPAKAPAALSPLSLRAKPAAAAPAPASRGGHLARPVSRTDDVQTGGVLVTFVVPPMVFARLGADNRPVAVETNTGQPPRPSDRVFIVVATDRLVPGTAVTDEAILDSCYGGDWSTPGVWHLVRPC